MAKSTGTWPEVLDEGVPGPVIGSDENILLYGRGDIMRAVTGPAAPEPAEEPVRKRFWFFDR